MRCGAVAGGNKGHTDNRERVSVCVFSSVLVLRGIWINLNWSFSELYLLLRRV